MKKKTGSIYFLKIKTTRIFSKAGGDKVEDRLVQMEGTGSILQYAV